MQSGGRVRRTIGTAVQTGRKRPGLRWLLLALALVAIVVVIVLIVSPGQRSSGALTLTTLPCYADESVTPFGEDVLYYDGSTLYSISATGIIRWHHTMGPGRTFSASDSYVVAWYGSDIIVIGRNGTPTYKDSLDQEIQFARVGSRYFAAVVGDATSSTLMIRTLDGTPVDVETENYADMMLLDVGFYGDSDQYVWSLSLDVYGTAVNTTLHTFQVGKMNTGVVDLGEYLAYRVLYEGSRLRVFTTQQMYTYDYKAVQDVNGTQLVYGWQLLGWSVPDRGGANMLLAPLDQLSATWGRNAITELRVLQDSTDRRFHLPVACVGAAVKGNTLYAVSTDTLYVLPIGAASWKRYPLPVGDLIISGMIGITSDGHALLVAENQVRSLALPE